MNNYSAYPAYKSSGIDWFGEIPEHWELRRLKFVASINPSKSEVSNLSGEIEVSFLPMERVGNGALDLSVIKKLAEIKQGFTYFRDGDVIVAKITPSFENGKGALATGLQNGIGFGTTELHVIRASKVIERQYLYYLTLTHEFRGMGETQMFGTAGQKRVPDRFINDFPTPLPPIAEQRAIAAFLDRETTHIDSLIAKKRELIDLLDKKRTSIISHAVTKGLNPNAKLKPSGVEWLGDVPEHWEVNLTKRFFKIDLGKMLDANKQKNEDGEVKPYLRAANIYWEGVWIDDVKEMKFSKSQLERYRLEKGDLLVTEGGVTVGRSAIWRGELEECYYQNSINRARRKAKLPVEFLYYWLYFLKLNGYIDIVAEKATFGHLTKEKLEVVPVVCPPTDEATEIVQRLDNETRYISEITAQIEDSIRLLQKQRIALISAAVTGKIDVREQGN